MAKQKRRGGAKQKSPLSRVPGDEGRELRQLYAELQTRLAEVNTSLKAEPEGTVRQESLRRARIRILFEIDRLLESPAVAEPRPPRFSGGPKRGIYTVRQGGSPGLGKRR